MARTTMSKSMLTTSMARDRITAKFYKKTENYLNIRLKMAITALNCSPDDCRTGYAMARTTMSKRILITSMAIDRITTRSAKKRRNQNEVSMKSSLSIVFYFHTHTCQLYRGKMRETYDLVD